MFPDSVIAQNFNCADTKVRYLSTFGLGEYFSQRLSDKVKNESFVLLFHESLNKKMQKKQMDVHLRFWNGDSIATMYYTSIFMGHAKATDLVQHLESVLAKVSHNGLIQLSMDGPHVNWKAFELLQSNLESEHGKKMLNVGSCGLHTVHCAFKTAMSACAWDIEYILFCAYILFKDSPARRDDFYTVTNSSMFPLKFAKHRWLENVPVLERFIQILPNLKNYVKAVRKKTVCNPKNKSFESLAKAFDDNTLEVKLHFVLSVANQMQPFLKSYQDDKPLIPFLAPDLMYLILSVAGRFLKHDVLDEIKTCSQLIHADLTKTTNQKDVSLGFSANKILTTSEFKKKNVSERNILEIKMDAKQILIKLCSKLLEKSPVQYSLARCMVCLNPMEMALNPGSCTKLMERLLRILVDAKQIAEEKCDTVFQSYTEFLRTINKGQFESFDKEKLRVDVFLKEHMSRNQPILWEIVRKVLLLSHGQATVERGFSCNKEVIVENQKENSLIARRIIKDHIHSVGGIDKVDITKEMIAFARRSKSRYNMYLYEMKEMEKQEVQSMKRKADEAELDGLRDNIKRIKTDIYSLYTSSKQLADKCEITGSVQLIVQSNSVRRTAEGKEQELHAMVKNLETKIQQSKQ